MARGRLAAIIAIFTCLVMAPVLAVVAAGELAYHPEKAAAAILEVSDKEYIPAEDALEVAEEVEQEQEAYYEPVCYYSNTYWYESDDAEAEAEAKEWIAWRESGGDYDARNGQYIGKFQLNEMYLDGDYSEEAQEAAAEAYVQDRYGSWQAAQEHWEANGWY